MSSEDLLKLGLDPGSDAGTKWLHTLVIYGTAAEIMKSLPKFDDEVVTIEEGKPIQKRILPNRETKNAVKYFIRLCRV